MEDEVKVDSETSTGEETGETSNNAPELGSEVLAELQKKAEAYDAQKVRAEKAEKEVKILKGQRVPVETDSIDLIKLGKKLQDYSDEELDFVTEHAKSKSPVDVLKALENPFIQMGIKANREKVDKEKLNLKPSNRQSESDEPISLEQALAEAPNQAEREKLLAEHMGYTIGPKHRADRVSIGSK